MSLEVTIGLPVFNGAQFIEQALNSVLNQTFTKWKLIVSDNASSDATYSILEKFATKDSRIQIIRQPENKGAIFNFRRVAEDIQTPYFMWMAADDVLEPDFIQNCVARLKKFRKIGMAFSTIRNVDSFGREIRQYPNLYKLSGRANSKTILRFVSSPEALGKANLIYSIYRTEIIKQALKDFPFENEWGGDVAFVLGAIAISGISITPEVLFNKRLVRTTDTIDKIEPIDVPEDVNDQSCPLEYFPEYKDALLHSVEGTRFWPLTWLVISYRHRKSIRIREKIEQAKLPPPLWKIRMDKALHILKIK